MRLGSAIGFEPPACSLRIQQPVSPRVILCPCCAFFEGSLMASAGPFHLPSAAKVAPRPFAGVVEVLTCTVVPNTAWPPLYGLIPTSLPGLTELAGARRVPNGGQSPDSQGRSR